MREGINADCDKVDLVEAFTRERSSFPLCRVLMPSRRGQARREGRASATMVCGPMMVSRAMVNAGSRSLSMRAGSEQLGIVDSGGTSKNGTFSGLCPGEVNGPQPGAEGQAAGAVHLCVGNSDRQVHIGPVIACPAN